MSPPSTFFAFRTKGVDPRVKPGHDELAEANSCPSLTEPAAPICHSLAFQQERRQSATIPYPPSCGSGGRNISRSSTCCTRSKGVDDLADVGDAAVTQGIEGGDV